MDNSGYKSFSPKVISFSGPLSELVFVNVSNLGVQVFLKPSNVGEDTFSYKKRKYLPVGYSQELISGLLDFYFKECSRKRLFYDIEIWPNVAIGLEPIIGALIEVVNHSEEDSLESDALLKLTLKWSESILQELNPKVLVTSFLGGIRIFVGEAIGDHFRERFPKGFELVLLYSVDGFNKDVFNSNTALVYNTRKVASFLKGLFYGKIDLLHLGMSVDLDNGFIDSDHIDSFFCRTAIQFECIGLGLTDDSHFLYSVFPNSLKSDDFYKELKNFFEKNRRYKVYQNTVDERGVLVT
nr:hypothetical protein [Saprospiraceae bacterium]